LNNIRYSKNLRIVPALPQTPSIRRPGKQDQFHDERLEDYANFFSKRTIFYASNIFEPATPHTNRVFDYF
jgi:hypothetical protein